MDAAPVYDLVLDDARVVTSAGTLDEGWVGVAGGRITGVGTGQADGPAHATRSLDGAWLGPGFIDVHTHGSGGVGVMDATADDIHRLSRFFATRGVTAYLAGTATREHERTMGALEAIGQAMADPRPDGAVVLGAYMEGPFLSPLRRGAHRERLLRPVERETALEYLGSGVVRAMVLAPELPGAEWLIAELAAAGVRPVAGHTDATYAQMERARDLGTGWVTHTFNGMRGIHHREPGAAGAALLLDDLVCEVIADGVHLDPAILRLVWRMKGPRGIAMITDAGPFGGMADGQYEIFDGMLEVRDGVGRLPDGTFSSSAATFDANFVRLCRILNVPFDEAWPVVSGVPAALAGVRDRKGDIAIGMDADLVALGADGAVVSTLIGGVDAT